MASEALQTVIENLRAAPLVGNDVPAMRALMKAAVRILPTPEGARCEAVDASGVPAEWTDADGVLQDAAIVYVHGGGYVMGGVDTHRQLCVNLSRAAGVRVLSVDYRLAPEHPFPAAVEDAVRAVQFVHDQGISPERVIIAGDSAGGGLTAATLLALRDRGIALPAGGVMISPWVDLTMSGDSVDEREDVDPMVSRKQLEVCRAAYLDADTDPKTPLASPLYADLAGLPPLLIHVGTAECLLDDARQFAEAAQRAGVDVEYEAWDEMIHVWHTFAGMLPEADQAIEKVGAFVQQRLA